MSDVAAYPITSRAFIPLHASPAPTQRPGAERSAIAGME